MPTPETIDAPCITLTWNDWKPLKQKNRGKPPGAPEKPGVYQIRCRRHTGDAGPEIVYIGRSDKGLKGRIDNHRTRPGQVADNLVNRHRFWDHAMEPIEVRWAVTTDSHYAEAVLLRTYRNAHDNCLPHFNIEG